VAGAPIDLAGHPGLALVPEGARWLLVLAHGAGAGMRHAFMEAIAEALAARAIATARWEFPFMAAGKKRPDPAPVCEAAVREVWVAARARWPALALIGAGKSMGARMTVRAQAAAPLPGLRGVVGFGFPLHPAKQPAITRGEHLGRVAAPVLLLQGTRDALADLGLVRAVVAPLPHVTLHIVDDADHGFAVRKRSGRDDAAVIEELADACAGWLGGLEADMASPGA
jgi:predicted alpha/beta-hydrolase family hydrolase